MPIMRGKAGLWMASRAIPALLALVCSGSYHSQNGSPNLKPFKPKGWSDVIVVSNRQGRQPQQPQTGAIRHHVMWTSP